MTGDEFVELFAGHPSLREYICIQAKRRSSIKENQEDSVQEAWFAISFAPGGYAEEFYRTVAYKAIYSSYWQAYKQTRLFRCDVRPESKNKTPERMTDQDRRFMEDRKLRAKDWRE